jgi:hypothetical protein
MIVRTLAPVYSFLMGVLELQPLERQVGHAALTVSKVQRKDWCLQSGLTGCLWGTVKQHSDP